jgi:hypothetical protein
MNSQEILALTVNKGYFNSRINLKKKNEQTIKIIKRISHIKYVQLPRLP